MTALAGALLFAMSALFAAPACAADPDSSTPAPAPTELVFARPQYLLWWESHASSNGIVEDKVYRLFTTPPDANGQFTVPDGDGGVFHHTGRLVGGPYRSDTELCPKMKELGIKSLTAWPPGSYAPTVTCQRFAVPSAAPGGGTSTGTASTSKPDEAQILAEALIGILLFGGGLAGLATVLGIRPRMRRAPTRSAQPSQAAQSQPDPPQPPSDPCAGELADYLIASQEARAIQALIQPARSTVAMLDQQIARLANLKMPMSLGIDLAFLASSVYSAGIGGWATRRGAGVLAQRFLAAQTLKGIAVEGLVKELIKSFGKGLLDECRASGTTLDSLVAGALDAGNTGTQGGAKSVLKEAIVRSIVNGQQGQLSLHPAVVVSRAPYGPAYQAAVERLAGYRAIAEPIGDAVANAISVANMTLGVADSLNQLEILRTKRSQVLDRLSELEVAQESAMERMRWTRERLDHCRVIWSTPGLPK